MTARGLYGIILLVTFVVGVCALALGIVSFPSVCYFAVGVVFFATLVFVPTRYRSKDISLDDSIYFIISDTDEIRIIGCSQDNIGEWLDAVCSENGAQVAKSYSDFLDGQGSVMIFKGTVLDYDPRQPGIEKTASHFK